MISYESFFKISYGLFIITSGNRDEGNGFISNTFFQVTSDPPRFATCCHKDNYTAEIIQKNQNFAVSIITRDIDPKLFGKFGFRTGLDINKLEGLTIEYGESGAPIVLDDTLAFLEVIVNQTIDVGTHWMFIGDLVQSKLLDANAEPMTYAYYREHRKGKAPKNAPTYIDRSKVNNG